MSRTLPGVTIYMVVACRHNAHANVKSRCVLVNRRLQRESAMTKGILGRKVGMTQVFQADGKIVPVTVIEAGPCSVLQIKPLIAMATMQFNWVFLTSLAVSVPSHNVDTLQTLEVHVARSSRRQALSWLREPSANPSDLSASSGSHGCSGWGAVDSLVFEGVKSVDVTGITKGCGFQGTMKKHNFKGQRATHGVKKVHRHPGGTSAGTYPGRMIRGKKMAGRYGSDRVTMRNLQVVKLDGDNHLLLVRGAIPGPAGGYVMVRESNKWVSDKLRCGVERL